MASRSYLRKTQPPAPGKMPKPVSGRQRVAFGAATRRSQARASSRPQPKHGPVGVRRIKAWVQVWVLCAPAGVSQSRVLVLYNAEDQSEAMPPPRVEG